MPTEYREYISNYSGEEIDKYLSYVESNENTLNFEPYRRLTNNTYLNSPITEENEENLLLAFPGNKTEAYILYSADGPLLFASKLRIRQTSGGYLTYISYTYGTHTYIRSVDDGLIDVNDVLNNKVNDMYEGTSNLYRAFLHPSAINDDVSITPETRHNTQCIVLIANEDERETEISTEPLIVMTKNEIEKSSNMFNWLYLSIRDNGFQPLTPFFELSYNFEFILDENAYDYEVFTRGDETEEGVIDHTCLRFRLKANIPETADTNVYIKSTLSTDTIGTMDFYPFIKKYENGDEINAPEYTTVTPTINEVFRDVPLLSLIGGLVPVTRKIANLGLTYDISVAELQTALNIEDGANKTVVDDSLSGSSTNPVQNKKVYEELQEKVDKTTTINTHPLSSSVTLDASDVGALPSTTTHLSGDIATTEKGANDGVATLDSNGKVPISQLPSYVDDIIEKSSASAFPIPGETSKIYVDTTTNLTYRWGGTDYVEISPSLALGETDSTAYAGNKGKNVATSLNSHVSDSTIHVTSTDKKNWNNKYSKPSGNIPKTDLANAVQTSLDKADSAAQASTMMQAEYDALETKEADRYYFLIE